MKTKYLLLSFLWLPLLAVTSVQAEDDDAMLFVGVGKKAAFVQVSATESILNQNHTQAGNVGAYVFFSGIEGASDEINPTISWANSVAFFNLHPDTRYIMHGDGDEREWELDWSTQSLEELNTFFPAGSYTIAIDNQQQVILNLPETSFPSVPLIAVEGSGIWRPGAYALPHGTGLELSFTLPDWDQETRVIHVEIRNPEGDEILFISGINDPNFLSDLDLGLPHFESSSLTIPVAAELLQLPHNEASRMYRVELLYSKVVDTNISQEGILGVAIIESEVRLNLIVARDWTYPHWVSIMFPPEAVNNPAMTAPQASFINDGIPNLIKYGMGMSLGHTRYDLLPQSRLENNQLELTYSQRLFSDLQYTVEVSSDLVDWFSGENYTEQINSAVNHLLFDSITVRDLNPSQAETRFMRLRIDLPEPPEAE